MAVARTDPAALRAAVRVVVAAIPPGQVMSYGEVARAAGYPHHARCVARMLDDALPWHRVVNARLAISPRGLEGQDELQRLLLEAEGVRFDARGRVVLGK